MRPVSDQSHLRYPLDRLLGSPGSVRILRALLLARVPRGVSALAESTGLTPQGVRNVLETLVELGVAIAAGAGRAQVYSANPSHSAHEPLRQLFSAERSRWQRLRDELRRIVAAKPAVAAAWLYGSAARGDDRPGSDIDLAVLAKGAPVDRVVAAVRRDVRRLEDAFGVTFSVIGLSQRDVARRTGASDSDGWWTSAIRDAQVLKGPHPGDLRGEAGGQARE